MNKVAIYCRLSDEDKNKLNKGDDSESIVNQRMMLIEYANKMGWHIYDFYSDDDYSGADDERPDFVRMNSDAEKHKFDIVLCKTQSRFTRNLETLEKYVHGYYEEWGIRFVTIVDNADTANKGNRKSRQIIGLTNQWYLEELSDNIRDVFQVKMRAGQYLGSFAPYGYKKDPLDNHKLIIDDYAADIVRMIYRLYLDGYGSQTIAQILTEKGIDKPTVYKQKQGLKYTSPNLGKYSHWDRTSAHLILTNPVYIGSLIQGKETTVSYKNLKRIKKDESEWVVNENNHPAIISKEDFYTVQKLLKSKRRVQKIDNKTHLFATKVKCAECGGSMVRTTYKRADKTYVYLRCKNYYLTKGAICSSSNSIRFTDLKNEVENKLNEIIDSFKENEDAIKQTISKINNRDYLFEINKLENEMFSIENQIKDKNRAIANLYIDKTNGNIDNNRYKIISETIDDELEKLNKRITSVSKEIEELKILAEKQVNFESIVKRFNINNGLTPELVLETIDYIEIGKIYDKETDRLITIHWKF